jgi:hypothetical protein
MNSTRLENYGIGTLLVNGARVVVETTQERNGDQWREVIVAFHRTHDPALTPEESEDAAAFWTALHGQWRPVNDLRAEDYIY